MEFYFYLLILPTFSIHCPKPIPLGLEDYSITDSQISVTSHHDRAVGKTEIRLNKGNAWCTSIKAWNTSEHLTIRFHNFVKLTSLEIQGMPTDCGYEQCPEGYTRYFLLQTSQNGENWKTYEPEKFEPKISRQFSNYEIFRSDENFNKGMLLGNARSNLASKTIQLKPSIDFVHYVRIIPVDYINGPACLRLELFGCEMKESEDVLMVSGVVNASLLTDGDFRTGVDVNSKRLKMKISSMKEKAIDKINLLVQKEGKITVLQVAVEGNNFWLPAGFEKVLEISNEKFILPNETSEEEITEKQEDMVENILSIFQGDNEDSFVLIVTGFVLLVVMVASIITLIVCLKKRVHRKKGYKVSRLEYL